MVISSLLSCSYSFLKDTAGFSPHHLPGWLFFSLPILSVSPHLLLFCFLLRSLPLEFPLLYLPASPCLLTPIVPPRRKKQKGKILFQRAQSLSVSIKLRPCGGFQLQSSLVVDVCWVPANIKTCRLGRLKLGVCHAAGYLCGMFLSGIWLHCKASHRKLGSN